MSAARTLTDADVDAIADRVVAKLRAPRPRPARPIRASDTDMAAMRKTLLAMNLRPKRPR